MEYVVPKLLLIYPKNHILLQFDFQASTIYPTSLKKRSVTLDAAPFLNQTFSRFFRFGKLARREIVYSKMTEGGKSKRKGAL